MYKKSLNYCHRNVLNSWRPIDFLAIIPVYKMNKATIEEIFSNLMTSE